MGDRIRLEVEGPTRMEIIDDAMRAAGSLNDFMYQVIAELIAKLDARLGEQLLALPPGTLLCVHTAQTFTPDDLYGSLTARQDMHAIATLDACTVEGRREVYTSPWLCRGCGRRAARVEGKACETCLNRFRRELIATRPLLQPPSDPA